MDRVRVRDGADFLRDARLVGRPGAGKRDHHSRAPRAEVRGDFETGERLRTVNEILPVNRSPANLLSGEFLDEAHGATAVRAKPGCGWLRLMDRCL